MTILLGGVLAAGILLTLSPWLWPQGRTRAQASQGPLARLMDAAGYAHAAPRVPVYLSAAAGIAVGAAVWLLAPVPVLAGPAAAIAAAAPFLWLRARARRLVRTRRALWPDVCDLLVASVRAGMALPEAVASLQHAAPPPLRPAFAAFAGDFAASGHFDSAAVRLKAALADPVADRLVETLRMARQVGGTQLVPILRSLGAALRQDAALRAEVEARQSWVRGAALLGLAAPWVILALIAMRPEGARAYTTPEGAVLVVAGAAVSAIGYRLMLHIGRLPEPRRWFG